MVHASPHQSSFQHTTTSDEYGEKKNSPSTKTHCREINLIEKQRTTE